MYDVLEAESADIIAKANKRLSIYEDYKRQYAEGKINEEMIKTFRDN